MSTFTANPINKPGLEVADNCPIANANAGVRNHAGARLPIDMANGAPTAVIANAPINAHTQRLVITPNAPSGCLTGSGSAASEEPKPTNESAAPAC
jgi:hypothetical protein